MNLLDVDQLFYTCPYPVIIAIVVPREHPYLEDIIARFDAEIEMFSTMK